MASPEVKFVNSLYPNGKLATPPFNDWVKWKDPPEDLVDLHNDLESIARAIEDEADKPIETVRDLEQWFERISDIEVSARGVVLRGAKQQD